MRVSTKGLEMASSRGFIAGIKDCIVKGFDDIDVKCMEEILKDAFKTSSDETIRVYIKRNISNEYGEKISPSFKQRMEEVCDKAVEEITYPLQIKRKTLIFNSMHFFL